jgi:hypothetical protein
MTTMSELDQRAEELLQQVFDSTLDAAVIAETFDDLPPVELAERIVKALLRRMQVTVAVDRLDGLDAFMIADRGHRRIVVDAGLDPSARVYYYLHALGHVARGHVPPDELHVRFEPRQRAKLPMALLEEERAADEWVRTLVARRLDTRGTHNPFTAGVLSAVHNAIGPIPGASDPLHPRRKLREILQFFGHYVRLVPDLFGRAVGAEPAPEAPPGNWARPIRDRARKRKKRSASSRP